MTLNFFALDFATINLLSIMIGVFLGSLTYPRWKALVYCCFYLLGVAIYYAFKFYLLSQQLIQ